MERTRHDQEPPAELPSQLLEAQDLAISTLGRIAQFWGFTFSLGRVFGLLYLSRAPLTRDQVQARLGISAGSASMTLQELAEWGFVQRTWLRGDRRVHFSAETDFWRMVANVLNERERREISGASEHIERALALAREVRRGLRGGARADADFAIERMERLQTLYSAGQKLLDLLLTTLRIDITKYRSFFRNPRR
jgi:DNA-binding transcriptional regulator GbsR (MarR family)